MIKDKHTKVFESQRLTADFVSRNGFVIKCITCEVGFHYLEFIRSDYPKLSIFFNYWHNGIETYDLLINKEIELHNVDKNRFLTLLQMLKPNNDTQDSKSKVISEKTTVHSNGSVSTETVWYSEIKPSNFLGDINA